MLSYFALPETSKAPENRPSSKETSPPNTNVQGLSYTGKSMLNIVEMAKALNNASEMVTVIWSEMEELCVERVIDTLQMTQIRMQFQDISGIEESKAYLVCYQFRLWDWQLAQL